MSESQRREPRFSGHESFVCRYGWLPKLHSAIALNPLLLKDEAQATITLGIGRNMVKSVQFWAEAFGVVESSDKGGLQPGLLGRLLLADGGWDLYLEQPESLWLLHWWISTHADIAAWQLVFGSAELSRFDRKKLVAALRELADSIGKKQLAASTLEQHASLFLHSYTREESASDDTSWCPLQDLGLFEEATADDGKTVYLVGRSVPLGLTPRVVLFSIVDFLARRGSTSCSLGDLAHGAFSPGVVFRLDEFQLRGLLESVEHEFGGVVRFVDTADTQRITMNPALLPDWLEFLWAAEEESNV
ncbi:DUF4007 family protein [Pseudomonas aeruginosa]|nr:DUF4007 family protein [Pseudomonas aeruginosa]MDO5907583.1 DUF4007 family protein [Pseudomonas aeruginosa]NPX84832.1 DUF4007 family protein [Pseudomonas aeruginosa]NPZ08292.1 DUF4007 family protein [Pseudomonas aeruginosa]NQC07790.1 DUF4007 family protein [Pseudomonas aeruginosa]OVY97662.1 hypothetical protein CDO37_30550 [Pseudomonas aeruginosa]